MNETIKELFGFSVKAQEREIDLIKNRLEFINWLFGVASALLFFSVLAASSVKENPCPLLIQESSLLLLVGIFSFIGIIFTFIGKWQGYNSIGNRMTILTLLDIQKSVFLKGTPDDPSDKKTIKFIMFEYLPEPHKQNYENCVLYSERKYSEILWLILLSTVVFLSLGCLLLLLAERII